MGNKDRAHATKRTREVVMPTVEEIVEEVRRAKQAKLSELVRVMDVAAALGKDRSHTRRVVKQLGIGYAHTDNDGTAYITREDAAKLAERLV